MHRRTIQEIGAYAHTISSYPLIAAVGGIAPRIEELPRIQVRSYANNAIPAAATTVAWRNRAPQTALFEDYRIPLNLIKIGAFIDDNGLAGVDDIARIQAHDAEQQTDYLDTLRAYMAVERKHLHHGRATPRAQQHRPLPGARRLNETSDLDSTTHRSGSGSGCD